VTKRKEKLVEALANGLGGGNPVQKLKENPVKKEGKKPEAKKVTEAPKPTKEVSASEEPKPEVLAPAKPATQPQQAAVAEPAAPKLSLKDQILRASQKSGVGGIAVAVQEAKEVLQDTQTVNVFVEAITAADALAIQCGSFDRLEEEVRREWQALSLSQIETRLQTSAENGDYSAKQVLTQLAPFRGSRVDVVGPLWRLYTEIVRPALAVKSYYDLAKLMRSLADKRLVESQMDRQYYPKGAVLLKNSWHTTAYFPAMERNKPIPMIQAGWPWVLVAEQQCKDAVEDRRKRCAEMMVEDTGLTPAQAECGTEGKIFLCIDKDNSRGALLCIKSHRRDPGVRIVKTIGMKVGQPSWIPYDAPVSAWPKDAADVFYAFQAWKKRG